MYQFYYIEPVVYSNSYFGDGNYPIVYSNMGCGGWESNIASCKKDSFLNFNCTRDNIAGVLCGYGKYISPVCMYACT